MCSVLYLLLSLMNASVRWTDKRRAATVLLGFTWLHVCHDSKSCQFKVHNRLIIFLPMDTGVNLQWLIIETRIDSQVSVAFTRWSDHYRIYQHLPRVSERAGLCQPGRAPVTRSGASRRGGQGRDWKSGGCHLWKYQWQHSGLSCCPGE